MTDNENLLSELNGHRIRAGLKPFADWRKARHMPMLEQYRQEDADKLAAAFAEEAETSVADEPKAKAPTYKEIANYSRSAVLNPVDFVHKFLDANPQLSRKAAVQALVEKGVNYSTARTQYQRWYSKQKGA